MSYLTFAEAAALLSETRRLSGNPAPDPRWAPVRSPVRRPDVEYQEVRTMSDPEPLFYPISLPRRNDGHNDGRDPGLDAYSAESGELIVAREVDPC